MARSEIEGENPDIVIKIIGIGGAGSHFVESLIASDLSGPDFIFADMAANDITQSDAATKIQLGTGLGNNTKPSAVHSAAIQSRATIETALADADMLVILCGMGGMTGSGASPTIAEIARSMGILTLAIVTWPFSFEGNLPRQLAATGLAALANHVDSLFVTNQDSLVEPQGDVTEINTVFTQGNKLVTTAVSGLIRLLLRAGLVCVDIEDARTAMSDRGFGAIGIANAFGEGRAKRAAERAVAAVSLGPDRLKTASGVVVHIWASSKGPHGVRMREINDVMAAVKSHTADDAHIIFGTVYADLGDELRVTVMACGIDPAISPK